MHRIMLKISDRKMGKDTHSTYTQTSNVSVISTQRATEGKTEWEGKEKMADANHGDPAR